MAEEKLPIIFFAHRNVDEMRTEGRSSQDEPSWVLKNADLMSRSEELLNAFDNFFDDITNRKNNFVPYVFVAKMSEGATAKSRRRDIMALFNLKNEGNVLGLINNDELIVKVDSTNQADEIKSRIKMYDKYRYAISCLETFKRFTPDVRIEKGELTYKVKLIDYQNYETNICVQKYFENELKLRNLNFKKTLYSGKLIIYKINENERTTIDSLIGNPSFEMILSVEPMPKYTVTLDDITIPNKIPPFYPEEGRRYETLGILDNGIASIPQLLPWIEGNRWTVYPENVINPTHGTFVAGIAVYGDRLEEKEWTVHSGIRVFDAAIYPDTDKESIDEDDLIENIKEAINSNYEKIKIWNLSVSVEKEVSDDKFSDFGIALDSLQTQYNILICKSAGNCLNFYKHEPKGRINEGADSVLSLVVGSIAHKKGLYDIADVDNPSPFTRIGPGPEFIIKPEVVHYGGNVGLNREGKIVASGVKSFSTDGSTVENVGTSYSTPRVAALATGLYQELNEAFDPLLIKGLIIHSASYPENLKIPEEERTNQVGFGVPKNIEEILYNNPYEGTLILRDKLVKGEYIDIMDFPMPKSLIRNGYFTGQIIATLVYEPILDPSQGIEYCQSNIDLKFGTYDCKEPRDTSRKSILNPVGRKGSQNILLESLYSRKLIKESEEEFALKERLLIQYADKYYPVKKYAVDLEELTNANKQKFATGDRHWYLNIKGLIREHTEQLAKIERSVPAQEFCLMITIKDPNRVAPVYDELTQGLEENNFWHSNISIADHISNPSGNN